MEFEICKQCRKQRLKKLISKDGICAVCEGEVDPYKQKVSGTKEGKEVVVWPPPKKDI